MRARVLTVVGGVIVGVGALLAPGLSFAEWEEQAVGLTNEDQSDTSEPGAPVTWEWNTDAAAAKVYVKAEFEEHYWDDGYPLNVFKDPSCAREVKWQWVGGDTCDAATFTLK